MAKAMKKKIMSKAMDESPKKLKNLSELRAVAEMKSGDPLLSFEEALKNLPEKELITDEDRVAELQRRIKERKLQKWRIKGGGA